MMAQARSAIKGGLGMRRSMFSAAMLLALAAGASAGPPLKGYNPRVEVAAPTRLDWTFVVSNRSLEAPPKGWLPADYDSTKQTYELFVPPRPDLKKPLPVVIFVSPSAEPSGWKAFE